MLLHQKTILITGGATGIGLALATALAAQGNKIIITGRRLDKLQEAQRLLPSIEYVQSDIADPESADLLFETLKRKGIVLDVLLNNAGVIETWDILGQSFSSREIFTRLATNLAGPIALTQLFIRQAARDRENYIVNITTEAAIMPVPILPLYSSSKSGLSVFTKSLRQQLKGTSFRVVEIIPPAVETKMTTEDLKNTTRLAQPDDFAKKVIASIEAGRQEYAPSGNARVLKIIRRWFPAAGLKLIDKMSRRQLLG